MHCSSFTIFVEFPPSVTATRAQGETLLTEEQDGGDNKGTTLSEIINRGEVNHG